MSRTPDESRRAEASRLYHSQDLSTYEVAKLMDVDPRTVSRWLGDSTRRRGPRGRTDVSDERVLYYFGLGMKPTAIAKHTGLSVGGVRRRLARLQGGRETGTTQP